MGSDRHFTVHSCGIEISIHAPRMGSDAKPDVHHQRQGDFNPRSPDGERRLRSSAWLPGACPFQSTLPGWGATGGELDWEDALFISIHAPRMGSDLTPHGSTGRLADFNPRSPDGERLVSASRWRCGWYFNPRSPDGERRCRRRSGARWPYFNPRSPDGERLTIAPIAFGGDVFQSTLPGWGATRACRRPGRKRRDFNPRSPDGERPRKWTSSPTIWAKSSIFNTDCIADRR